MRPGWNDEYFVNSLGYFHWPAVWVAASPVSGGEVDARRLKDTVYRKILDSGVEVKVYRDGMFAFRLSDWPVGRYPPLSERVRTGFDAGEIQAQRVRLLNTHLACLYTALWRRQNSTLKRIIISPDEVIQVKLLDDDSEHITRDERFESLLGARIPSFECWRPPPEIDWRFSRVMTIELGTVEESFEFFDRVLQHREKDVLTLTDLYARAAKHHEEHNHDVCLITSWAIVERLLNRLWEEYIDDNRRREVDGEKTPFINQARKRSLTEGQNFTASVMIEILSLVDRLPLGLYEEVSLLRKARNGWIHGLEPVSREVSGKAIRAAEALLKRCLDLKFAVPLGPGQRREEGGDTQRRV